MLSNNTGWIKLHRAIMDNPRLMEDNDYLVVWVKLLMLVTHSPRKALFQGKTITLKPGQMVTSRAFLSEHCHIHRSKLERILKWFESEQQIEQVTTSTSRCITILNWTKYQSSEQANEQQVSSDRAASEHIQEDKELKNIKKSNRGSNVPTLEEAKAYFTSEGSTEKEAISFFNYYDSQGWKRKGGILITKWKSAAAGWINKATLQPAKQNSTYPYPAQPLTMERRNQLYGIN